MSNILNNKVAIVTGGTRGIGFAIVKKFLAEGAKVALFGSKRESVEKALSSIKEGSVIGLWPNLADSDSVSDAVKEVITRFGRVDILANNAGVTSATPFEEYSDKLFDDVMTINVKAIFNMIKAVEPIMKEQGSGVIINTSSVVSKNGQRTGVAYPVSKFAVNGLTISLARELGPFGIRVNAVAPGITNTDMVKAQDEKVINYLVSSIPLRRIGDAEDIANAYLFLSSDYASYINGAILAVDGGIVI